MITEGTILTLICTPLTWIAMALFWDKNKLMTLMISILFAIQSILILIKVIYVAI